MASVITFNYYLFDLDFFLHHSTSLRHTLPVLAINLSASVGPHVPASYS